MDASKDSTPWLSVLRDFPLLLLMGRCGYAGAFKENRYPGRSKRLWWCAEHAAQGENHGYGFEYEHFQNLPLVSERHSSSLASFSVGQVSSLLSPRATYWAYDCHSARLIVVSVGSQFCKRSSVGRALD